MTRAEIQECVLAAYKARYPDFMNFNVTEVVLGAFGGSLAVVAYDSKWGRHSDEICFVSSDGHPRIYGTTAELARDLERRAKAPLLERLFAKPVISGSSSCFY
jgi:hypothetical protein